MDVCESKKLLLDRQKKKDKKTKEPENNEKIG